MNRKALAWGTLWLGLGIVVATGAMPGSDAWSFGPRIGMAVFLVMLGLTVLLAGNAAWILRRTTRPSDYESACPVGARCAACATFNMKPRTVCKSCGVAMTY